MALIHIPLVAYPYFIQSISQLLLHDPEVERDGEAADGRKPWAFWLPFVNVSVALNECSIVCPRDRADELFVPVLAGLSAELRSLVTVSREDYSVIAIGGEGLEAGQRVLDLTSPLAMAKIPIFFITSYWSDFILVPLKSRGTVIHALEERNFVFKGEPNSEGGLMTNPASPLLSSHNRNASASSFDYASMPGTPPPTSVTELQARTFRLLKQRKISPLVDDSVELVTCAGIKESTASSSTANFTQGKLQHGLLKCLTSPERPKFMSVTLTDLESTSLTIEKRLLSHFDNGGEDLLLGKDGPEQIAITLDLKELPNECTGIVCGVASRLVDGMKGRIGTEVFNMSYLSTAKAGHVIVYEDELEDAMDALQGIRENGVNGVHTA